MRHLVLAILFLVAGVMINLGVTWALWSRIGSSLEPIGYWTRDVPLDASDRELWTRHAGAYWPPEPPEDRTDLHAFGLRARTMVRSGGTALQGLFSADERLEQNRRYGTFHVSRIDCGWPARSVTAEVWQENTFARGGIGPVEHDGWIFLSKPVPAHALWCGFTLNTFFYAIALWLLTRGLLTLRRALRRRQGLCTTCGYDQRQIHGACPECGT